MSKQNDKKRKVAIGIAALGVAGLAISAAATLNLTWQGNFEAGAIEIDAACQDGVEIAVGFSEPQWAPGLDVPWKVESLEFSDIESACVDLNYEVAIKVEDSPNVWQPVIATGNVSGSSISAPLDVNAETITHVALTIFD